MCLSNSRLQITITDYKCHFIWSKNPIMFISRWLKTHHCFAKAVPKLRTTNSLSVRLSGSCAIAQANSFGTIGLSEPDEKCISFKVKRFSCAFPLRNKLSAKDCSFGGDLHINYLKTFRCFCQTCCHNHYTKPIHSNLHLSLPLFSILAATAASR